MLSFPVYMSNFFFLSFHLTPFKWERRGKPKGNYSDLKISKVSAISCASFRQAYNFLIYTVMDF